MTAPVRPETTPRSGGAHAPSAMSSAGPTGGTPGARSRTGRAPRAGDPLTARVGGFLLGLFLLVTGLALGAALLSLWPAVEAATQDVPAPVPRSYIGLLSFTLTPDTTLLLLVAVVGGLGSEVHGATSFATYVGNRRLKLTWAWWYVLRLVAGATLAMLIYFALRAGILTGDATSAEVNPYGIALIAGLAGLFSKQAVDKLREVFDTLLHGRPGTGDDARGDKLASAVPVLAALIPDPDPVSAGTRAVSLTLIGHGFTTGSVVSARAQAAAGSTSVDAEELEPIEAAVDRLHVVLPDGLTAAAGLIEITVVTPPPGGGTSQTRTLRVT